MNIVDTLAVDDDIVLTAKTIAETYEHAHQRDFDLLIINMGLTQIMPTRRYHGKHAEEPSQSL